MRVKQRLAALIAAIAFPAVLLPVPALSGDAKVVQAKATKMGAVWRFDVTVSHSDTGWDHYADAWRVVGPDGTVYGTRKLFHPHVDEQPFTRSLSGVKVPAGVAVVTVEARDNVHGWGQSRIQVTLP